MAIWQLECVNCNKTFEHSIVDESGLAMFFPPKPEFPEGGSELQCPHCGHKAKYQRYQLTYQA
jgi:DNA-directed RNA polymerase subunit RPC12/RpoP